MARRAAASLFRLLPVLLLAGATVVLAAALFAACGGSPSGGATSQSTPAPRATTSAATPSSAAFATPAAELTTVRVYFLRGEHLGVAQRQVPHTTAVATAAMTALCDGPSAAEAAAGLSSAVPRGTKVLSVAITDGVATVDLSRRYASGGGSLSMQARVAQVVYTLTQFPTVRAVDFELEGAAVDALGGEGLTLDTPQQRADWRQFEPPIFVESPGVGAVLTDPFVLRGTASVFEGTFTAQLTDSGGRRIARATVQASMGAPERGTFLKTIAYSTEAKKGWLVVYETSMKDGSRLNVVRIPVTFGG